MGDHSGYRHTPMHPSGVNSPPAHACWFGSFLCLGLLCLLLLLGTLCYAHTTPAAPPTMCAHFSVHGYKCAHTRTHHAFIATVSAHHHTQPQDQPPPCTESPSERPCRQAQTHQQTRQRRAPQQRQQRETPSGWVLLGGNFGVWYPYRKPLLHV